jgi:hypothetical protein
MTAPTFFQTDRTLARQMFTTTSRSAMRLDEAAQLATTIAEAQPRADIVLPLKDVGFAFLQNGQRREAVVVIEGVQMAVAKSAWTQLTSYLEPTGIGKTLAQTAGLDSVNKWRGTEVSSPETANLMYRSWSQRIDKPLRFRTKLRASPDGSTRRTLEAVVSEGYVPLADTEALAMAIDHFGGDRQVVSLDMTDTSMRVRLADSPIELCKPTKVIECWNSETGHRSLSYWGRLWKLICTNGMASVLENYARARYSHVGDMRQRVADRLPEELVGLRRAMGEAVDMYETAGRTRFVWGEGHSSDEETPVEAFFDALNRNRKTAVPDRVVKAVKENGLRDSTSSEYGTLAGLVDGITLLAQKEALSSQKLLEDIAADIMTRGLQQRQGELIHVRPFAAGVN